MVLLTVSGRKNELTPHQVCQWPTHFLLCDLLGSLIGKGSILLMLSVQKTHG